MMPGKTIINIENLSVQRQGRVVLENISLSLKCGDTALLTGPNGCGKTTLLRSIAGFLPASEGRITLFGKFNSSREWKKQCHLLAYVPQEELISPFPVSVEEMAAMGTAGLKMSRAERQKRTEQALKDTGCWEMRQRSYFSLSGGEKRRVALARCLGQKAHLLLLDEPLSYLDTKARKSFIAVLEDIRKQYNITILMVTHTENELEEGSWSRFHFKDGLIEHTQGVRL
ncbi:MAG: hypothetical protein B6241_13580 [Spirochaetaceae bacterium 4572_59]|nr:MAG: hypothetical protein B6241_13580 [Spirochaetaceae bacterium 4572_59]